MQRLEFISSLPLFRGLSDRELEILSQSATETRYPAGALLANDAQTADRIFLVKSGQIKLSKTSSTGKEQTLQVYGSGDLVGLFSLFTGNAYPASVVALEESCLLVFGRTRLERTVQSTPGLLVNLFCALASCQAECIRTVENLALKEIPQRLAAFLLLELNKSGQGRRIHLGYSHRELAKILGTSAETLSRILSRFTQENILSQEGRDILILNRHALEEIDGDSGY